MRNSAQQLLLAQNPQEIPFIAETVELSEREANELGRLKTVKGRHAQMLWLNGARGHGKVTLRVGPSEYWAFTSDPTEVAIRDETIAEHDGNVWAAINALARRGTRAHRDQPKERAMTAATAESADADRLGARARARLQPREQTSAPQHRFGLGPLLAVCGLAGGAGVTTLSYLIALAAVRQWTDPVLVADTGGPSGGLAACAGVEVPRSLGELAQQLAAGVALGGGIYAAGRDGLRVLATGPEFSSPRADDQVRELLADAREAHGLTVIDCGTLAREAEQTAAAAATHVAWVLTATTHGVSRGRRVLDAAPRMAGKELDRRAERCAAGERAAARAAGGSPPSGGRRSCSCRTCPGSRPAGSAAAAEAAQVPVQAILGALRR